MELGAIFLNGAKTNPMFPLLKKYNLSYVTPDPDDWIARDTNGADVTDQAETIYERKFRRSLRKVESDAEKAQAEGKPDYDLRSALLKAGWKPKSFLHDVLEYFELGYSYAVGPEQISVLHNFIDDPLETVNNNLEVIKADEKGYVHIIRNLLDEATEGNADKLKLNQVVTEVEEKGEHVIVTTKTGEKYTADFVIVTFGLGVFQNGRVKFNPPLPDWKMDSINHFQNVYYTNIHVQFDTCFWDDHQWILHAGERGSFNIIINFNKVYPGSNIINLQATDKESVRIERLSDSEIIKEVVAKLQKIYGKSKITIPQPIRYGISRFSQNPLFDGAYSNWPPGFSEEDHKALKAPVGRIYFAGEYTSYFYYGYMHGAYNSGIDVSDALHKCIQQKDCQSYLPASVSRGCRYPTASIYDAKAKTENATCQFCCVSSASVLRLSVVLAAAVAMLLIYYI